MNVVMPTQGTYVVAVSGGVDSMALLHMLQAQPDLKLVVAHFDHGIRPDSIEDRLLVEKAARQYDLPFAHERAELGSGASEAKAREARYIFLHQVRDAHKATKIITAHHQDDVLETAIINILRGTNRKGLVSLRTTDEIERPLLGVPKSELLGYAEVNNLQWREDSTNQNEAYLRNYVRKRLVSGLDSVARAKLLELVESSRLTDQEIDTLLVKYLSLTSEVLSRSQFNQLPHAVAREVLAAWLRNHEIRDFDKRTLERLVVAAKTGSPGQSFSVLKGAFLDVKHDNLALRVPER